MNRIIPLLTKEGLGEVPNLIEQNPLHLPLHKGESML
jgi:hypothetical protein